MNRGFGFYFGHAIKSSCKTLWHKGNLLKYWAWVIMELLAPFTLVLGAMFSLANVRQAKIAERENTLDIPQSFKVACRAKPFWTMFLATVLEALIFLAGVLLIGVATLLLGAIGYAISLFVSDVEPMLIIMIFCVPGGLMLLVYSVIMPILLAPTAYVIETNPDIGAADAISICFNTMKSRGKGTYFLTVFVTLLIEGAILGLGAAAEVAIALFVEDIRLAVVLGILVGIVVFVGFALVAPMFSLARKISQKDLFEDIVLDPVNASKHTSGVNIKKCKGVKFDPAEYENELALLFDETYSDRVPVPENPAALRKKKLDERTAARAASYAKTEAPANVPAPTNASAPAVAPAAVQPETAEEEDGELLTVSDLIRDVEPTETKPEAAEEPAAPTEATKEEPPAPAEEPAKSAPAVEPEKAEEVPAEIPAEAPAAEEPPAAEPEPAAEPVRTEEPAAPAESAPEPEKPAKEPAEPAPVKKPAAKPAATKTTATVKPATTKTTATKTATKTAATTKPAATKTTAAKTTATKTTATAKPAATKTTATVKAKTAEKASATKTTATVKAKTTTAKKTAAKPADGDK